MLEPQCKMYLVWLQLNSINFLTTLFRQNVFDKRLEVEVNGVQVMKTATQSPVDVGFLIQDFWCRFLDSGF